MLWSKTRQHDFLCTIGHVLVCVKRCPWCRQTTSDKAGMTFPVQHQPGISWVGTTFSCICTCVQCWSLGTHPTILSCIGHCLSCPHSNFVSARDESPMLNKHAGQRNHYCSWIRLRIRVVCWKLCENISVRPNWYIGYFVDHCRRGTLHPTYLQNSTNDPCRLLLYQQNLSSRTLRSHLYWECAHYWSLIYL